MGSSAVAVSERLMHRTQIAGSGSPDDLFNPYAR